ncbi:hypothetical protein EZV62_004303 [Acer yangbiense]|uniref:Serine-threonine/tyrosine-protein kinase catalytic domain-containing protein n=1 Tax=Acer yangbiense TaxID=1000413 RepID=A0A5C7IJM3_9ROSI|nr:hypothetical protein EZV62_004303 [Acer yangbiense]
MEFAVEVEILARVRHKNLLSLRGYCAEGQERLIVYDYMPNLSLLSHLHGQHSAECLLDWNRRMNIAVVKRTITDWALPLACESKFSALADPRLNGKFVEDELKRVVLVALICAHSQPEKRPTILEVVELLKGESKQKLTELENDELFKSPHPTDYNDGTLLAEDSSDFISEEKDPKPVLEEIEPEKAQGS